VAKTLTVIVAILYNKIVDSIPIFIDNNYGAVPGHFLWVLLDFVALIFALPLVIAAWQKHKNA
jgi:hypothetical protein